MNTTGSSSNTRQRVLVLSTLAALVLAACDKAPAPPPAAPPPPAADAQAMAQAVPAAPRVAPVTRSAPAPAPAQPASPSYDERPQPVYTDYRAPVSQPAPIAVPWAPPPMRVEEITPQPSPDASWTGGYWVWREGWTWAPGRWSTPPRPQYHWVPPYYEHRDDRVVFVDGFWSPPGIGFVRPAAGVAIALAVVGAAVAIGHPPVGPEGVFVPPPPGSRPGLLVPAPIGTAPAVVVKAPAIIAPGMRVNASVNRIDNSVHDTRIDNRRNSTVVNNITNVTIEAPAATTVNHQAVRMSVPSQPHRAAELAVRQSGPAQRQPEPQERSRLAAQTGHETPSPRPAEPPRQAATRSVNENAMKRASSIDQPTTAVKEPARHNDAPAAREPEPRPAHPAQAAEQHPARPPAPAARPAAPDRKPAPPALHAEPARPAQAPHPAAERARPAEPPHEAKREPHEEKKGEPHEENGRKER